MTAFSPVKLHGRNNAPWPVIISAERTLFLRVFIGVSVSREECSACFIKTTRKPVTAVGFLNDDGWPRFSVPMAKMCCNVAPYQCHGLGDYFGALWSAWLLNLSSPQTALCLGYTVTPSAIRIHQLVKNGPLFQPGSQKQQRHVIPCYELSTMTIPLAQIGPLASAVLTGFAPLTRRRNLRDVTCFMSSCLRCVIFERLSCSNTFNWKSRAWNLWRSNSNRVKLQLELSSLL